ncbi:MAG TPA: Sapep family Mn(2+)-dependent dipeptidase [Thermoanaerobaculia bacterium]|nr:Sapep family Mn(2+)-dependent dipeptidase [Thermoanaerobaculia bacterium]
MLATLLLAATVSSSPVVKHYNEHEAARLVPMLTEVLRFPTDAFHPDAHVEQKAWLAKTAAELGFTSRDAGKITEIELAGPAGAPVLGLVIHGDVQPAEAEAWSFPPYEGRVANGFVLGRGAADDKGPLVQTLLAMKALKESGVARTHTIRLLVGSEEESNATEMAEYLKTHTPPDYSLVLDSEFPVVVGEKAWDGLGVSTQLDERAGVAKPYRVESIDAGLSASIVPDRAEVTLRWMKGEPDWTKLADALRATKMPEGTRIAVNAEDDVMRVVAYGKSAHSGVNINGGRNALVALARALEGKLPSGGANDLFAFARLAGQDLYGSGFGITDKDAVWGRYTVNVGTVKRMEKDASRFELYTNLRRIPPKTAAQAKAYLEQFVADFNKRTGASLVIDPDLSYFSDEPLGFDPQAKIVKRLMNVYAQATGVKNPKPAISGGGTYAKRLPNAIAFGMWFPGKPYPGHDVDEKILIDDLQRGARVLVHALTDLATGPKMENPFAR